MQLTAIFAGLVYFVTSSVTSITAQPIDSARLRSLESGAGCSTLRFITLPIDDGETFEVSSVRGRLDHLLMDQS